MQYKSVCFCLSSALTSGLTHMTSILEREETDLNELLDYLDSVGQKAIFVIAPHSETIENRELFNYVSSIVESREYDFYNFCDNITEMELSGAHDLYDPNHMNVFGSAKYTDYLAKLLVSEYGLENNHSDAVTQQWSEGYALWSERKTNLENTVMELMKGNG